MNVGELIQIARNDYLDQLIGDFVSDNDLMFRALNEAQRQACNRTNFLYDETTSSVTEITLIDGQSTYQLSGKITDIEYISFDSLAVKHVSKHELDRTRTGWRDESGMTGKDALCITRGHSIRFIPTPNATDALTPVKLEVFRMPLNEFTTIADIPEIPEQYHRDLIYWAIYESYSNNTEKQDLNKANYYLDKFNKIFGEYVSSEVRLNQLEQDRLLTLRPVAYATSLTQTSDNDDWS